jgi:hypothetical protein
MRTVVHVDPDFGVIAAAVDDADEIVATASASHADGVYIAVDEAGYFAATGCLLPVELWERAVHDENAPQPSEED